MADRRRWTILAVGTFAQAATCCFLYGIPMLVPALRASGVSLFAASLVVSAPMVGLLLTLILWGAVADRRGERVVIVAGVGAAAALLVVAAGVSGAGGLALPLALGGGGGGVGDGRPRRPARAGRCGRGIGQRGERARRHGLVPAAGARAGDGHPTDRAAARRGAGRARTPPAGPFGRRPPRAAVPGCVVRAGRGAGLSVRRRPAAAGAVGRRAPGDVPVPRLTRAGPGPSCKRDAGGAAVRRRDVHAGLPRPGTALGSHVGRSDDLRLPARRCRRARRGRRMVRPRPLPAAADAATGRR